MDSDSFLSFATGTGLILAATATALAYLASVALRERRDGGRGVTVTLATSRPLLTAALILSTLCTLGFMVLRLGVMS